MRSERLAAGIASQIRARRTGAITQAVRVQLFACGPYAIAMAQRHDSENVWGYARFVAFQDSVRRILGA